MQEEQDERYEEEILELSDYIDQIEEEEEKEEEVIEKPQPPIKVSGKTAQEIIEMFEKSGKKSLVVNGCSVSVFSEVYVAFKKTKDGIVGYDYDTNTLTIK